VCAFGDGSELFPYGYWNPYINNYDCTSGTREFRERFVTVDSYISNQFDCTLDKGKRIREFPIVKDIDAWHTMLAPMMIRRCRDEPEVMRGVKIPKPEIKEVWITPSKEHIDYYKLWLDEFAEWFMAELKAELAGDHKMDTIMLLVQIGKLAFVSTIPQSEKIKSDKVVNYNWNGNLTQKQEKIIELAAQHINQNQKVIVYSERPELQKLLAEEFKKKGIKGLVFTGKQPIPVREEILREFRVNHAPLLLATTTVGGTGLNLPEASVVIFADQSWTPAIHEQAIARVCPPQQKNKPLVYKLINSGFIDEYMREIMKIKQEGISEGIDWQPHTFDPSKFISWKDISYRYLQQEGYI
jgi:SNF2 family DNA or RNA helicase